jgi:helix-turn-helix protein
MDSVNIPGEKDFKQWIKESLKEYFEGSVPMQKDEENVEPLHTRKEIAKFLKISLVTLHDWMKRGLPFHKKRGRVYFIRSEVIEYIKTNKT